MSSENNIETNSIIEGLSIRSLSHPSQMKKQDGIKRGDDCFFPVSAVRLQLPQDMDHGFDLRNAPLSAVVNMKTGEYVGSYAKGESLISNQRFVETFEPLLRSHHDFEASYATYGNGQRFEGSYTLRDFTLQDPDGLASDLTLTLRNSYNGQWKLSLGRKVRRLICLNGMESLVHEKSLAKRHVPGLDVATIAFNIADVIQGAGAEMEQFNRMAKYDVIGRENILKFLGNAVTYSKGGISKNLATRIAIAAIEGDATDPKAGTLWALYNAGTRVMRDLAEIRPESMVKAGKAWSNLCVLSANPNLSSYAAGAFRQMMGTPKNESMLIDID